jgi:tRNA nucleotidyltransferase (CCA-adding enzyme)
MTPMPGKDVSFFDIPPFICSIVVHLQQQGHRAYVVGGALRDLFLERDRHDWDVATSASPAEVIRLFPHVVPVGYRYGTVLVLESEHPVEVSTLRGKSIEEDLRHRDFTVNAMAFSIRRRRLIDPFGGIEDLDRRIIRAVSNPDDRFLEDPLRILRAVRIAAELDFSVHSRTWKTMKHLRESLRYSAPERIRQELNKMLLNPRTDVAFGLLKRCGALHVILPELLDKDPLSGQAVFVHAVRTMRLLPRRLPLRLAALLHDIGKPVGPRRRAAADGRGHALLAAGLGKEILERLRYSRKEIEHVVRLILHHAFEPTGAWSNPAIRRFVYRVGPSLAEDLLALRRADVLASGGDSKRIAALEDLRVRVQECLKDRSAEQIPALTGNDIMRILGVPSGPLVGEIKRALQQRVIERPESNTREQLVKWLKERYLPLLSPPHLRRP